MPADFSAKSQLPESFSERICILCNIRMERTCGNFCICSDIPIDDLWGICYNFISVNNHMRTVIQVYEGKMKTTYINGRTCHIVVNDPDLPAIYWGEMKDSARTDEKVLALCEDVKCNYIIFEAEDWNDCFSPWELTLSKKKSFPGGGRKTLEWLINECVPFCENEYGLTGKRIICGYSLAGLFSLWAFYESQYFSGVISCSGSLWFRDWIRYAEGHTAPADSFVYLSLGDREEKARDKVMAAVGDCTRRQYELVSSDKNVSRYILEWNQGGHFNEPEMRIAKGIKWCLNKK